MKLFGRLGIAFAFMLLLGLLIGLLGIGSLVTPTAEAGAPPTSLGRTPWEMHRGIGIPDDRISLPFTLTKHGDTAVYAFASIPPETDLGWGPAPNGNIIGFSERSKLGGSFKCLESADFTYFQTFVDIPLGTTLTEFKITFSGIDDGARIIIFNSTHPPSGGLVPGSDVFLGGSGTANLASLVALGEHNRVVVVQVDDCAVQNNLREGRVELNGSVIPPNRPPSISANSSSVTVNEGQTAANTGSYSDPDSGDNVAISASVGSVTKTGTNSGSWSWAFATTDGPAQSQTVTITATDSGGATAKASFPLTVKNVAPVLDKGVVDLNTWTKEDSASGGGNWTVQGGGSSVFQSINGLPTVFYSNFNVFGQQLNGKIKVETTGDNDYIGFVIGFSPGDFSNSSADYLLVDWKQGNQNAFGGTGKRGLAVSRVTGFPTPANRELNFWSHSGVVQELARGNTLSDTGWGDNVENEFTFEYDSTRLRVFVNGTLELDVSAPGGNPFTNGRLGFYNFSQCCVRYRSFQIDTIVGDEGSPVGFSKDFTDAGILDTHAATIKWGDGDITSGTVAESGGSGTVRLRQ